MTFTPLRLAAGILIIGIFAFFIIKDHDDAVKKGLTFKLDQLNSGHLYGYLYDVGQAFSPDMEQTPQMRRLALYYSTLAEFLPDRPEPNGLAGFAYYHTGDLEKAYKAYSRAADLDPEFFWYGYNRAALLAKARQPDRAVTACRNALRADPKYTINRIMDSREVYLPLLLAKISQHYKSCSGSKCLPPEEKLRQYLSDIKGRMTRGYGYCEEVVYARDNPDKINSMAAAWPLGGF